MTAPSLVAAQQDFSAALPAVDAAARFAFRRRMRPQEFEEALAEARAAAWSAWAGLLTRGKNPVEVGASGIAQNAVRSVRNGRKVGNPNRGRGAMDVHHPRAQKACGFKVVSLESGDAVGPGAPAVGTWREWLAEDNRNTPADEAAFRVDFATWLEGLPAVKRWVAELLSAGHGTGEAARLSGVTAGRVSQLRGELEASWRSYQGEAEGPAVRGPVERV
jgi:hypothetical protein